MTKIIHRNKQLGMTLIEVLIYLALFTLIIGGAVVSIALIIQNTQKTQTKVLAQDEANFILAKIAWTMTGASSVTVASSPTRLTVVNSGTTYLFTFDSTNNDVTLQRNSAAATVLNNQEVSISAVSFTKTVGPPDKIQADITVSGTTFQLIKALR